MYLRAIGATAAALVATACEHGRSVSRPVQDGVSAEATNDVSRDDLSEEFRADADLAPFIDDARRLRLQILIAVPDPAGTMTRHAFRADAEYFNANDNETINDDRYEYERVANPFIAALGRFVATTYLHPHR
jgi:hypothetical protein